MPRATKPIRWEVYIRPISHDHPRPICYVRAIDTVTGKTLLTKSTGSESKKAARAKIAELSSTINFARLASVKTGSVDATLATTMEEMPLSAFFIQFWDKERSLYLQARSDSGKPLSSMYVSSQWANIKNHADPFEGFRKTLLRDAGLFLIESYVRHLRDQGLSGNIVGDCLNAIRTPLSWAMKRNMVATPFSFSSIVRPKEAYRKRGILSTEEVKALIKLEVADTVKPRPRLKKGEKHLTPGAIDLRIKVGALLSHLTAMRTGEIRGLRWASIDWDKKIIMVELNYVEGDGEKAPKRGSSGQTVLADGLVEPLKALRTLAFKLGRFSASEYVLFSLKTPGKPIPIKGLEAGYGRALEWIGISPEEQKSRHLTLHGGRHFSSTTLADKIGPERARRITRHRSIQAFQGYTDHETEATLDAAREAMRFGVKVEEESGQSDNA